MHDGGGVVRLSKTSTEGRSGTTAVQISQALATGPVKSRGNVGGKGSGNNQVGSRLCHLSGRPIERQLPIMPAGQRGRRLIGIVQPPEQVPVHKQLLAQQRAQIRKRPAEGGAQLQILPLAVLHPQHDAAEQSGVRAPVWETAATAAKKCCILDASGRPLLFSDWFLPGNPIQSIGPPPFSNLDRCGREPAPFAEKGQVGDLS